MFIYYFILFYSLASEFSIRTIYSCTYCRWTSKSKYGSLPIKSLRCPNGFTDYKNELNVYSGKSVNASKWNTGVFRIDVELFPLQEIFAVPFLNYFWLSRIGLRRCQLHMHWDVFSSSRSLSATDICVLENAFFCQCWIFRIKTSWEEKLSFFFDQAIKQSVKQYKIKSNAHFSNFKVSSFKPWSKYICSYIFKAFS